MTTFDNLSLRPETRAALTAMAVSTPTPIQAAALPAMLAGRDVIGQARTGSGKTLAFALPLVERVDERCRDVQALVLVPTRELAAQVAGVVRASARGRDLRVLLMVGGLAAGPQAQALRRGVHVVVGTPGRVLDHLNQGNLRLSGLRLLVLDEADEMLDRGFAPDVERIIAATNPARQTALFSATVPDWVGRIAAKHLHDPLSATVDAGTQPVEHVAHTVYDLPSGSKLGALRTLLDARGTSTLLVFGRTKHGVRKLARQLEGLGYPVAALQGNLSQPARDRVMADFRSGATPILIATNVAARGLDVEHVAQVINYELPETAALLTHRVGRTGRMGRSGEAITLLTPEDDLAWRKLLRELRRHPVRRPWRGLHDSEHVSSEAAPRRTPGVAHPVRHDSPRVGGRHERPRPGDFAPDRGPAAQHLSGGSHVRPPAADAARGDSGRSLPALVGGGKASSPASAGNGPASPSRPRRRPRRRGGRTQPRVAMAI